MSVITYSKATQGSLILFQNVTVNMFGVGQGDTVLFDNDIIPVCNDLVARLKESYNYKSISFNVSSGYRAGDTGAHGQGKAFDFAIIADGNTIDNKYPICALNDIAFSLKYSQFTNTYGAIGNIGGVSSPTPSRSDVITAYYTHLAVNFGLWWGLEYVQAGWGEDVGSIFNSPWNCTTWYEFPWVGGGPSPTPTPPGPTPSKKKRKWIYYIPNINNKYF